MVRTQVGYFGLPGSFSHEVALHSHPQDLLLSFEEQAEGFRRLRDNELDAIVVPFENSIGGAVAETLDQLMLLRDWEKDFKVLRQLACPIELCLLSRCKQEEIRKVYSHFVPLQVTARWIREQLPQASPVLVGSTSAAADRAAKEEATAAVANLAAAQVYGLKVVARNLSGGMKNVTRFLVIGRQEASVLKPLRRTTLRRAMVHLRLPHRFGALADVLTAIKRQKVNLTQILSRPVPGRWGEHQFLLEMDAPPTDVALSRLLHGMKAKAAEIHILGVYPVQNVRPLSKPWGLDPR